MTAKCFGPCLAVLVVSLLATAGSRGEPPTPLGEAVEAVNRKAATGFLDAERLRTPLLPKERRPAPVTVEEVVAAIRGWDRKKEKVPDATYRMFEGVAESKSLPPGAALSVRDDWVHPGGEDKYEYRVWRVQLDVMTGKDTGYGFVVREQRLDRRVALLPAAGYEWLDAPRPVTLPAGWSNTRVVMVEEDRDGALVITAAWPVRKDVYDVRVVAFDADGNRHLPTRRNRWGGSTPELHLYQFRLDPSRLPGAKARFVGVEGVTGEGLRASSDAAVKRAKEKGVQVLPLPEVGRPFEFSLAAVDGKVIDSRKLRGKVVLIDCWASWCGPCVRDIPDVARVYRKWREKGLEVVGVSLDEDPKQAAAAAAKHELPWPLVVVPAGEEARRLWDEASRIEGIPRYLLVDRAGVLRADLSSARELEKAVAGLLLPADPHKP